VDDNDLFPGGITFNLATIGLNNGNAWVGFTAATGGGDDNQDIQSWSFNSQSQAGVVTKPQQLYLRSRTRPVLRLTTLPPNYSYHMRNR